LSDAEKGILQVRVSHGFSAVFDDPNLVSCAGLAPVLELAQRARWQDLIAEHVHLRRPGGANPQLKISTLVAGTRAPSTLGTFLRSFTFGHVRQLDAVNTRLLTRLTARAPLLAGAAELVYLDVDDTVRQTFGYAKQGAGRGYTGVQGLNALIAAVSTPASAPVIAAARLRKGSIASAKGAPG
jgi:hypothetical protein